MGSKIISIIVGGALIAGAILLSVVASGDGSEVLAKKAAMVEKYVKKAEVELEAGNLKEAKKYAKLAIGADPKDKAGYKMYDKVMEVKYKPAEGTQVQQAPVQAQPVVEEEDEGAMGC
jgi:hypothetical protein